MATDCTLPPGLDVKRRPAFRRRLLSWYAKHQRDLPWRRSPDPYRVWISEVMLQQTQVATVEAYFLRFVEAFPTVEALAAADEQQVLRLWEGLGYYRRARGLHAAAKLVVDDHGGQFPHDVPTLMQLPGIGRYTAGAIASIAFDRPAPILESNTVRLLSRLIGYRDDPTKSAGQRILWQTAKDLLPRKDVARFNQALMELGSLVCTPKSPACDDCPVVELCEAARIGMQSKIPVAGSKQQYIELREAAVVVRKNGKVLLRQCAEGQRWAGLWDFPRFAVEGQGPLFVSDELVEKVVAQTGVAVDRVVHVKTIKHGVTRYRITLDCYEAQFRSGRVRSTATRPIRWLRPTELSGMPLSATGRKIAKLLA